MFTKEKINAITTALGLAVVLSTTLTSLEIIDKKIGNAISGFATSAACILVYSDPDKSENKQKVKAIANLSGDSKVLNALDTLDKAS